MRVEWLESASERPIKRESSNRRTNGRLLLLTRIQHWAPESILEILGLLLRPKVSVAQFVVPFGWINTTAKDGEARFWKCLWCKQLSKHFYRISCGEMNETCNLTQLSLQRQDEDRGNKDAGAIISNLPVCLLEKIQCWYLWHSLQNKLKTRQQLPPLSPCWLSCPLLSNGILVYRPWGDWMCVVWCVYCSKFVYLDDIQLFWRVLKTHFHSRTEPDIGLNSSGPGLHHMIISGRSLFK